MIRDTTTHCHGCDREKAATDFCPNCEEVTPVYEYDGPAFVGIDDLIRTSRQHDAACIAAVDALPSLRVAA